MAKPEQGILSIEPQNELKFEGPFISPVVSFIKLTNVTERRVHFKLKTTAPKKYCVRPNSGVLPSKGFVEVQVLLQPFNYIAAEKHKHKFMVQFMVEPEGWVSTVPEDLWKCIAPDKIMNCKLKCVFEMPSVPGNEQQEAPQENTNVQVVEKVKRSVDNNKLNTAKSLLGNGSELQKVAAEVQQLRDDEMKLQKENIALKEELTRLHQKISGKDAKRHTYTPPATQAGKFDTIGQVPVYYYGIAVLIAFLGFWLGKFNC